MSSHEVAVASDARRAGDVGRFSTAGLSMLDGEQTAGHADHKVAVGGLACERSTQRGEKKERKV